MKQNILLVDSTRWPTAARLAIAFSNAGATVSGVFPTRHPGFRTGSLKQIFPYSGLHPKRSLINAIEATAPDLLIACDEFSVQHLHELHADECSLRPSGSEIAALIEKSLGSPQSYPVVSSRFRLLSIAQEEGIRVPDMRVVRTIDDLASWETSQTPPWVLKADTTRGGLGVRIVENLTEARHSLSTLNKIFSARRALKRLIINRDAFWLLPSLRSLRPQVIVQKYVFGSPANCAVSCWEGKILAGISVEVRCTQGATEPATVVRVIDHPQMMTDAERIASRLALSGVFGLDFIIESVSGSSYLIEMNPRCTPLCHLRLGRGHDLVGALWSQVSKQLLPELPPVTDNELIAYFPQALHDRNKLLESSFLDIPENEEELVKELLRPWPERTFLWHLASYLQRKPWVRPAQHSAPISLTAQDRDKLPSS